MQFLLDHIAAIFIMSLVLLIGVMVQSRGSMSAIETHISGTLEAEKELVAAFLEWDVLNMIDEVETLDAISGGRYRGKSGIFTCQFTHNGTNTTSFTFPTLDIPPTTDTLSVIDTLNVVEVEYRFTANGDSISLPVGGALQNRPLFSLERFVNDTLTATSGQVMTYFNVERVSKGAGPNGFTSSTGSCPPSMTKIRYEFKMAVPGIEYDTHDQRSTSRLNMTRQGNTIHLNNW